MNIGDKVAVSIQGHEVVQAEVKEVSNGTATLIIPATRVVMAVKTELAPEVTADTDTTGTEHIIDEVVRTPAATENASGDVVPPTNDNNSITVNDASKVISSSSVPTSNPGDPQNVGASAPAISPAVQEQINAIVAEHLAAVAAANDATQE